MIDKNWLDNKLKNTPWHNGKDLLGLEKAKIFFSSLLKELESYAEIDLTDEVNKYKADLKSGMKKLHTRIEKIKGFLNE